MFEKAIKQLKISDIKSGEIIDIQTAISYNSKYISESKWNDILYNTEKSKILQQALSVLDCQEYNKFVAKMIKPDMYHLLLQKQNLNKEQVKEICKKINPEQLKKVLLSNYDMIADIFKQELAKLDFDSSKRLGFVNYAIMDGIEKQMQEIIKEHSDETEAMIAICNNTKLSDETRNLAFNTIDDPLLINHYTNYMKTSIYNSIASQIFDYPQKNLYDMKKVDDATEVLLYMIENKQLLVSCEYDLLQRLQTSPTINHNRKIMNTLLQNTKDAIILRNAYEFNPIMTQTAVRNNKHCDIFVLEKFLSESIKNIKEYTKRKTNNIGIINEKEFIANRMFKQPFSLKSYQQLHSYSKKHDELLDNMIIACPYIRINSLKEMYNHDKTTLIKLRERLENEFGKNDLDINKCFDYICNIIYQKFKQKEQYFQQPDSMSVNMFFKYFDRPIERISKKEMKIISMIAKEFENTDIGNEIKTLDETIKMVYNKENMFGNYRQLYLYKNNEFEFNVNNILQNNEECKQFKTLFLKFADIVTLEKLQNEIKDTISKEPTRGIVGIHIANNADFIVKLNDRILEIEKAIEERNGADCI